MGATSTYALPRFPSPVREACLALFISTIVALRSTHPRVIDAQLVRTAQSSSAYKNCGIGPSQPVTQDIGHIKVNGDRSPWNVVRDKTMSMIPISDRRRRS